MSFIGWAVISTINTDCGRRGQWLERKGNREEPEGERKTASCVIIVGEGRRRWEVPGDTAQCFRRPPRQHCLLHVFVFLAVDIFRKECQKSRGCTLSR